MIKPKILNKFIVQALREDCAYSDITSKSLIPAQHVSHGIIIAKENAVLCGLDIAKKVFQTLNKNIRFKSRYKDGSKVKRNAAIATIKGNTRALLAGERTALNFLGHLSGIATHTHQYAKKVYGNQSRIYDTRKTTPGLRLLEKYAVQCGGGLSHRYDLNEFVLIKDNHREVCRPNYNLAQTISRIKRKTRKTIEVEVDNLNQFYQALSAHPDIILLDNMSCAQMKKAVLFNQKQFRKKRPLLEASGGITLKNISAISKTGVDRISIGAITHSHKAINFSMEIKR